MNHEYISKFNLIDQYVLGKLAEDEVEEFEDHFVDCPECVDQLNISRSFVHDLKGVAVQETLFQPARPAAETHRWNLQQLAPVRLWAAIACCCVLVVAVFAYFAVRRFGKLEAELRQAKEDASTVSQKYQQGLEAAAASEQRHQETAQNLTQRIDELEKKIKTDQSSNRGSGAPEINFPIYALISVARSQGPAPVEVDLSGAGPRFALSIPVEERKGFKSYRVTILDHRGVAVFNQAGFRPDTYNALSLSLNSNFLTSGNYDLKVEGLTEPDQWTNIGTYQFRVARRR